MVVERSVVCRQEFLYGEYAGSLEGACCYLLLKKDGIFVQSVGNHGEFNKSIRGVWKVKGSLVELTHCFQRGQRGGDGQWIWKEEGAVLYLIGTFGLVLIENEDKMTQVLRLSK